MAPRFQASPLAAVDFFLGASRSSFFVFRGPEQRSQGCALEDLVQT
jgi:hypothetical protein